MNTDDKVRAEVARQTQAMKRGFTLIEILIAVAIIGIMGAIGVTSVTKHLNSARETAARDGVMNIKSAITTYMIDKKKSTPPSDLKVLIEASGDEEPIMDGGEGALVDPWDTEYKLEVKGKRFVVISAGPDQQFGTDDDLRSDKISKKKN